MKTTMSKIICMLICILCFANLSAQEKSETIVGKWLFSAPEAPYGYDKGELLVKDVEGKLSGDVKIQGVSNSIKEIKKEENNYSGTVYVDGFPIFVSLIHIDGVLSGKADADGNLIPVTFVRAE